ncbi:MAG: fumarylacetoacetate hydrolase family protein [Solirubrobacteraceae bacterium]
MTVCEKIADHALMKLATFSSRLDETALGAVSVTDATMTDLAVAHERLHGRRSAVLESMLALIEAGAKGLAVAAAVAREAPADCRYALADVRLLAPLPEPPQIRDFMCFEEHVQNAFAQAAKLTGKQFEVPAVWYQQPIYYKANRFAVNGPEADVTWPSYSQVMDYELELACVIGTGGRDIPRERAAEHIFGFTIFNDASARDAQFVEMAGQLGPAKGKDFDTGNVLGPWIVTAEELTEPYSLEMVARVNDEEWSRGNSGSIHHRFEDMIEHVSRDETLHPGEILGSGTVGTGCGLELGRFLADGDVVELEIEGIGVLRNRFVR